MHLHFKKPFMAWFALCLASSMALAQESRKTVSLNGTWEVAEGEREQMPSIFGSKVPVPGLIDMASPPLSGNLDKSFWYRRAFTLTQSSAVAVLKINRAMFGAKVYLNGSVVGEEVSNFNPSYYDVKANLKPAGQENVLVVRVGSFKDVPSHVTQGVDLEKKRYIPGIFDDVEMILSGTPHIIRIQAVPEIGKASVRIHAVLGNSGDANASSLTVKVREALTGKSVSEQELPIVQVHKGVETSVDLELAIPGMRPWSPEDPFLYEAEVRTEFDSVKIRFGMRSLKFDGQGRALLNGMPYYFRGTNVTIYRFFEDSQRGGLPWDTAWVRKLHRKIKSMHWNSMRYCIGFPPAFWYRIADEEGILIQDEYPRWQTDRGDTGQLKKEFAVWIHERANHPSLVIWDASNEITAPEIQPAIQAVRALDLSNRPWENSYGNDKPAGDIIETHPYLFIKPDFRLSKLATTNKIPFEHLYKPAVNPMIVNEYEWLWLTREGNPTTLTRDLYKNLLGATPSVEKLRYTAATYAAALTEFWRHNRKVFGVQHFCVLGYSRDDGQTSDNFTDVKNLEFEPNFFKYVRDAFAPVGVMLDVWSEGFPGGTPQNFPVVVINDLQQPWSGQVRFRIIRDGAAIHEQFQNITVASAGSQKISFTTTPPVAPGFRLEATLLKPGFEQVRSVRDFGEGNFEIPAALPGTRMTGNKDFSVKVEGRKIQVRFPATGKYWIEVFDLKGKVIGSAVGISGGSYSLARSTGSAGICLVEIRSARRSTHGETNLVPAMREKVIW